MNTSAKPAEASGKHCARLAPESQGRDLGPTLRFCMDLSLISHRLWSPGEWSHNPETEIGNSTLEASSQLLRVVAQGPEL